jgi:hypothetical protein
VAKSLEKDAANDPVEKLSQHQAKGRDLRQRMLISDLREQIAFLRKAFPRKAFPDGVPHATGGRKIER